MSRGEAAHGGGRPLAPLPAFSLWFPLLRPGCPELPAPREEGQELGVRMPAVEGRRVQWWGFWAMEGTVGGYSPYHADRGDSSQTG